MLNILNESDPKGISAFRVAFLSKHLRKGLQFDEAWFMLPEVCQLCKADILYAVAKKRSAVRIGCKRQASSAQRKIAFQQKDIRVGIFLLCFQP